MRHQRILVGVCAVLAVVGCDSDSPTDLHSTRRLTVPDQVSFAVATSGVKAAAVSWTEIDISWAAINNASGYEIWRSATGTAGAYTLLATTAASALAYVDNGLTASTQYCYEIRSFKAAGKNTNYGAFSGPACATTLLPPVIAPSETNATPAGSTITVVWKDNSPDEDGFRIEQATTTAGPWYLVVTVGANVTTTNVDYVPQDHIVCFRVTAFNSIGPSLASNADCTALPSTPRLLTAKSLDQQTITLTWADNSTLEDGYKVSRLQSGSDWVDIASVGANVTTYVDATASVNTSYTYRVQALKDGGSSLISNEVATAIATSPPAAPDNLTFVYFQLHCSPVDGSCLGADVDLSWNDFSTNEEGFRIDYSGDGVNDWTQFALTGPNVNYWSGGPTYTYGCFRVIAFNSVGSSSPSNVVCGAADAN